MIKIYLSLLGIFILAILSRVLLKLLYSYKRKDVKGYKDNIFKKNSLSYVPKSETKDKFKEWKLKKKNDSYERYDVIIIGSGVSGLTTGVLLSKLGWKVLVLEQHDVCGGSTHCFKLNGYEFDTGIHYVGNIEKRIPMLDFLYEKKSEWTQLGRETGEKIYDEYIIDGNVYKIPAGKDNLLTYLKSQFPEESDSIENYIELCERVAKKDSYFMLKLIKPKFLANIIEKFVCRTFKKYAHMTIKDVMDEYFVDETLKKLIGGLSIDGGPPPNEQSFFMHASIVCHFMEGGYYPVGGPSTIGKNLAKTIYKYGNHILTKAYVEEILVDENDKAYGVVVKDRKIYADKIISAIGVRNTYLKLLPQKYIINNTELRGYLSNQKPTFSYNFCFIGLKDTDDMKVKFETHNKWIWDGDFSESVNKDPNNCMFMASNSAKDPEYNLRNGDGKHTMVIITWANIDTCEQRIKNYNKSQEYKTNKEELEEIMIRNFLKMYPEYRENIDYVNIGTPETVKNFLGSMNGECYGLDANTKRFDYNIRPDMGDIENLYLTGQDVTTLGFTGVLMSGILTTNVVAGYNTYDMLCGRNIYDDLVNKN